MVKKVLIYLLVAWIATIVFAPKESLYFAIEKLLAKRGVYINEQKLAETPVGLHIENGAIYIYGIKAATFDDASFSTVLLAGKLHIEKIRIHNALLRGTVTIDECDALHTIVKPTHIVLDMNGTFGHASGDVDMRRHRVRIDFSDANKTGMLKSLLKKDKKGWYYETAF